MKKLIFAALLVPIACSVSFGQVEEEGHSDIEFGYDDFNSPTEIIIESDELTDDGIQIVEGDFAVELGEAFADSPGFITIATEDPDGERETRATRFRLNSWMPARIPLRGLATLTFTTQQLARSRPVPLNFQS